MKRDKSKEQKAMITRSRDDSCKSQCGVTRFTTVSGLMFELYVEADIELTLQERT